MSVFWECLYLIQRDRYGNQIFHCKVDMRKKKAILGNLQGTETSLEKKLTE